MSVVQVTEQIETINLRIRKPTPTASCPISCAILAATCGGIVRIHW